jgi:pyruvate/2-oxoglutarate dehydrogenase complex dihydrolipoamide dehydrogenase (E3) component
LYRSSPAKILGTISSSTTRVPNAAKPEGASEGMAVAFEQRRIGLIIEVDGITGIVETWKRRRLISSRGKESVLEVGAVVFAVGWPGNAHNVNLTAAGVEIGVGGYVGLATR